MPADIIDLFPKDWSGNLPPKGPSGTAGGGDDGGMDSRVARIERDVEGLMEIVGTAVKDLAEIKGKVSQMPTAMQLWAAVVTAVGLAAALVFGAIKIAQP